MSEPVFTLKAYPATGGADVHVSSTLSLVQQLQLIDGLCRKLERLVAEALAEQGGAK